MTDAREAASGAEGSLRAAAEAVARASGWTNEQLEGRDLEGSLPWKQARAALDSQGARASVVAGSPVTADEALLLARALGAWQVRTARVLAGVLTYAQGSTTEALESAHLAAQEVDALVARVDAWRVEALRLDAEQAKTGQTLASKAKAALGLDRGAHSSGRHVP